MKRIKEVLENKWITQSRGAEKLEKNSNLVNGYVQNRQEPRMEILYQTAEILDIEIKENFKQIK